MASKIVGQNNLSKSNESVHNIYNKLYFFMENLKHIKMLGLYGRVRQNGTAIAAYHEENTIDFVS